LGDLSGQKMSKKERDETQIKILSIKSRAKPEENQQLPK